MNKTCAERKPWKPHLMGIPPRIQRRRAVLLPRPRICWSQVALTVRRGRRIPAGSQATTQSCWPGQPAAAWLRLVLGVQATGRFVGHLRQVPSHGLSSTWLQPDTPGKRPGRVVQRPSPEGPCSLPQPRRRPAPTGKAAGHPRLRASRLRHRAPAPRARSGARCFLLVQPMGTRLPPDPPKDPQELVTRASRRM